MIKKGLSWLDVNFEPILMSALFYTMTILIVVQVGLRYFLGLGLSWGEELSRIIFVWLMYFAISYATRNQRHIRVSFLVNKTPEKVQKVILMITDFLFLAFTLRTLVSACNIVGEATLYNDRLVAMDVGLNVIYMAGVVGLLLMSIRLIQNIVWRLRHLDVPIEVFENINGKHLNSRKICFESGDESEWEHLEESEAEQIALGHHEEKGE